MRSSSKLFDTIQVVYNALNPSAGGPLPKGAPGQDYGRLFERAKAADMGTIIIRALAGGALSGTDRAPSAGHAGGRSDRLGAGLHRRRRPGEGAGAAGARKRIAGSLTELAERFVIAHPAVSTMLIGYSTLDHLEAAIAAVNKGPLPEAALKRIAS